MTTHGPRVVIVTGSEGGIGQKICQRFEEAGDIVVAVDVSTGNDVTITDDCQRVVDAAIRTHGRIDVLCNNAGVGAVGDVLETTDAQWRQVLDVNVLGTVNMCRCVIPHMRAARHGVVVNTCSIAADIGLPQRVAYSASKGAVLALTRALAADELAFGIRVNCVSPATVDGPWVQRLIDQADDPVETRRRLSQRQPLGVMIAADDVAAAIVYLADPATTTTGCELKLDAGITGVLSQCPPRR